MPAGVVALHAMCDGERLWLGISRIDMRQCENPGHGCSVCDMYSGGSEVKICRGPCRSVRAFEESLGAQSTGSSILIISSSKKPLHPKAIQRHFSAMFGGVQGITINRDFRVLDAKISRLDAWIAKLEAAETELVRKASRSKGMPTQPLLAIVLSF